MARLADEYSFFQLTVISTAFRLVRFGSFLLLFRSPANMDGGLESTRQIRKLDKRQPIIIGVTAHVLVGQREDCLGSGMNDYLSKPYLCEQLLGMIQSTLQRSFDSEQRDLPCLRLHQR